MHRFETIDLGTYRGEDYFFVGFVEPAPDDCEYYDPDDDADEYGVSIARTTDVGSNIEIIRLDTAHGQRPHLDLVYLPSGSEERKYVLDGDLTYERMRQYLLKHWRRFAELYVRYNE